MKQFIAATTVLTHSSALRSQRGLLLFRGSAVRASAVKAVLRLVLPQTTVKWRQFSQPNRHSTFGTRQTEYHEALPSSADVQSHLTSSFANDGNASWYSVCRLWKPSSLDGHRPPRYRPQARVTSDPRKLISTGSYKCGVRSFSPLSSLPSTTRAAWPTSVTVMPDRGKWSLCWRCSALDCVDQLCNGIFEGSGPEWCISTI